jgi:hypothetical protein
LPVAIPNAQVRWRDAEKEADVALNQEQNGGMEPDQLPEETPAQTSSVDESRRRFTMAGVAASGVLLTLASRPVLGTETALCCKSPSGWISGNKSTHGPAPVCEGVSPGYWKNHTTWPIPNRNTALFRVAFPSCAPGSVYYNDTMLKLLKHQDYDKNNLAMHLVAAYLNAVGGRTPFLPVATVQAMFTEWQSTGGHPNGYYTPTAGVQWNAWKIVAYITATQS